MRISISTVLLLFFLLMNGCGGGGGGSSSSSTSTTPTVFASGNSMAYLRHLTFDGNYLYVVDSNTVDTSASSYAHLRQFSATTSGSTATTFENTSEDLKDIFSVVKFNSDLLMTANVVIGSPGVIKVSLNGSTYSFTTKVNLSASLYGLAVDSTNNRLFVTNQSGPSILIYDQYYVACGSTNTNCTISSPISGPWTRPTGLAYNGNYGGTGYIYVTDYSGGSAGLYKINASTLAVTSISSSLFKNPNGIAVNTSTGDVYVVNTGTGDADSSILKITDAGVVSTFLDGSITSNMLCKPIGAAISGSYLYITNGICTTNWTYASSVIKISL
jgi:DNA-binding beta-propeller fold protein YncE